jgi:hypothetical protein
MAFPLTLDKYLYAVAKETSRLSWPGRMHPILVKNAKKDTEKYFISNIFHTELRTVWTGNVVNYDSWHKMRVSELVGSIAKKVTPYNAQDIRRCHETVAAKLMDAFMYQLMKYPKYQLLWKYLHLVLDGKVFAALRALARNSIALNPLCDILRKDPYTISFEEYQRVQEHLRRFIQELNNRSNKEFDLTSPIQLNILWADGHKS